jgi:hypothetical protein
MNAHRLLQAYRTVSRIGWLELALLATQVAGSAAADCRTGRAARPQRSESSLVIVPFAVPVAVPVAVLSQPAVLYAYSRHVPAEAHDAQPSATADDGSVPDDTAHHEERARRPDSIVARSCLACHAGESPQGGMDLTDLHALQPAQRLGAIARVVSDDERVRMPRGAKLSPAQIGALIQELSAVKQDAESDPQGAVPAVNE